MANFVAFDLQRPRLPSGLVSTSDTSIPTIQLIVKPQSYLNTSLDYGEP